jgi:hypothetical protein
MWPARDGGVVVYVYHATHEHPPVVLAKAVAAAAEVVCVEVEVTPEVDCAATRDVAKA